MVSHHRGENPVLPHMFDEGLGFILYQQVNGIDARIHEITQDKVHYPVSAAERDRGF
jgi:hypothetical protein